MIKLLQTHKQDIGKLCQTHHVKSLSVFGSAARESDYHENSDLDFMVEFQDLDPITYKNAYFGLLFGLEDLTQKRVDLITKDTITNPYVHKTIEKHKETLYALT
ncbi:MAG: nucleotidyltransferase domain-containing protein [Trueperaceae bacterium]|nr:nucleotidyltransferase domain-containing protein [Trueperaceae bacterium]